MDELSTFYASQGVLGITVAALVYVLKRLWELREKEREEHKAEIGKITDQRLLEMQSLVTVVKELKQQQADFLAYKKENR